MQRCEVKLPLAQALPLRLRFLPGGNLANAREQVVPRVIDEQANRCMTRIKRLIDLWYLGGGSDTQRLVPLVLIVIVNLLRV
jgi:hypothetical protein